MRLDLTLKEVLFLRHTLTENIRQYPDSFYPKEVRIDRKHLLDEIQLRINETTRGHS